MLIRCDKCSTLYELDEKLLPAQGAPVQCSKCQFVFKAYPSPASQQAPPERAANDAPVEPAEEPELAPPPAEQPHARRDEVVREGGALAHSFDSASRPVSRGGQTGAPGTGPIAGSLRSSGADEQKFTSDGRPIRKIPFPSGEPPQQGPRTPPMKGAVPKPGRGATPAVRWAVVAVVALVVVLFVAWFAWRGMQPDRRPPRGGAPAGQSRAVPQGGTPETPARN